MKAPQVEHGTLSTYLRIDFAIQATDCFTRSSLMYKTIIPFLQSGIAFFELFSRDGIIGYYRVLLSACIV